MPSAAPRSRWRFVIAPRWLAWHAFTVAAVFGMLWLGDWQFHRAEGGNALSWAYTFEWPIFAAFGLVFWVKTIVDEGRKDLPARPAGAPAPRLAGIPLPVRRRPVPVPDDDETQDDPELDDYNAYLAQLNQQVQGHGRWHGLR